MGEDISSLAPDAAESGRGFPSERPMTSEGPINLNKARKAKARAAAAETAARNRVIHGRTKADKTVAAEATRAALRRLDQTRREP